jgi:rhodanese-related sulfurtransferase
MAGLVLAAAAWGKRSATARETEPDELKALLDKGDKVLVIDVRSDQEIKSGSIPGAIHIPMEQLEARMKDSPEGHSSWSSPETAVAHPLPATLPRARDAALSPRARAAPEPVSYW